MSEAEPANAEAQAACAQPRRRAGVSAFFCIPKAVMQKFCIFSHVLASARTSLQTGAELRKVFPNKGVRHFLAELSPSFPSWTSPVRIRSPALKNKGNKDLGRIPCSGACSGFVATFVAGPSGKRYSRHRPSDTK